MTTSKQANPDLGRLTAAIERVIRTLTMRPPRGLVTACAVLTGKLVGITFAAVVFAFVSIFGFASTGTPIGALTGAAAASATYYWIGSLLGFGAVGGAAVIGAGSVAAGTVAGARFRRVFLVFRPPETLSQREAATLVAAIRLKSACDAMAAGSDHERAALRILAEIALRPYLAELEALTREAQLKGNNAKWGSLVRKWQCRNLSCAAKEVDAVIQSQKMVLSPEVPPSSWPSHSKGLRAAVHRTGLLKKRWFSTP